MELVSHTHHAAEPNDSHCDRRDSGFDLNRAIDSVSHWLPTQGPLKDFIHHNTLHAVQHLPFHEASRWRRKYSARAAICRYRITKTATAKAVLATMPSTGLCNVPA